MSDQPKDGGPAFPHRSQYVGQDDATGMSLRDWFAGQALTGLASGHDNTGGWAWTPENVATTAYIIADAMLAAKVKP